MVRRYILFFGVLLVGCVSKNEEISSDSIPIDSSDDTELLIDIDQVLERGKIIAAVENSSAGFFIYRGKSLGFQYELLQNLAGILDLELEIKVTPNLKEAFEWLEKGEVDILAYPLTITRSRRRNYLMTDQHYTVKQVLIQRKPPNWRNLKIHEIEGHLVRNQINLIGKKVHVRHQTSFPQTLRKLSDEIGGDILIVEEPAGVETQDVIRKVAEGEFDYAVTDEDVARIYSTIYPNIDVATPVSFPTQIGWALRKNSTGLGDTINYWLRRVKRQPTFNVIYRKYFENRSAVQFASNEEIPLESVVELGLFDAADTLQWDWRLLLSQIYQESEFNPNAKSWAGAVGLMQVLPTTARSYGVVNLRDPVRNIFAGTRHLLWLKKQWDEIEDTDLQIKFMLASYNVGLGHIMDVQALARKYDEDPYDWSVIEKYLLLKKKPKYFRDPVVKYGYCRGNEPVNYVREILSRFNRYQQFYPDINTIRDQLTQIASADQPAISF